VGLRLHSTIDVYGVVLIKQRDNFTFLSNRSAWRGDTLGVDCTHDGLSVGTRFKLHHSHVVYIAFLTSPFHDEVEGSGKRDLLHISPCKYTCLHL